MIAAWAASGQRRAPASWADPAKTDRVVFEIDVTGFDPATIAAAAAMIKARSAASYPTANKGTKAVQ
jgi:hypothetical protein